MKVLRLKKKVLVTTVPFCEYSRRPLELLETAEDVELTINPIGRKLTEQELADMVAPFHALIAGTESISAKVLAQAKNLEIISRVGVGLDSVDLLEARRKNVAVAYTAEAPATAVAELTIGLMLDLLRRISEANKLMHSGQWKRFFGGRIGEATVGIIGCGRIGGLVVKHLKGFSPLKILVYDVQQIHHEGVEQVNLETLLRASDIISVHVPLTKKTVNLINEKSFSMMKPSSVIVNTARGGIINEEALHSALIQAKIQGAAMDVFEVEPYKGPLSQLENCLLTSHMGSMSFDCRSRMELEATQDVLHFFKTAQLLQPVPETEYDLKK